MNLPECHRELIERALDVLAGRCAAGGKPTGSELRLYERAVSLVREVPHGQRRIRSDFQTRRPTPQRDLPIEPDLCAAEAQTRE